MRKSKGFLAVLLFMLTMSFAAFGQSLTTFSYSVSNSTTSPNTTGSGTIVGTIPDDPNTTTVTTVVVPVVFSITQGPTGSRTTYTFDPTASDSNCLGTTTTPMNLLSNSPLFQAVSISINGVNEGTVQWLDAIQRAQFRNDPNHPTNSAHHTKLSFTNPPPGGLATLTITIDAGASGNSIAKVFPDEPECGTLPPGRVPHAVVDMGTIQTEAEAYVNNTSNGIDASKLPLFVMYNTSMANGVAPSSCTSPTSASCDVKGFHKALGAPPSTTPTASAPGQTYVIGDFQGNAGEFTGVKDISEIAAEIAEWANDPSTVNAQSPAWGSIGEESGCVTDRFEVGEPLKGTLAPSITHSGFTYNFQEVAFFSWFYRDSTSRGDGGKFSSNGTFTGFSKVCPTGGTN